MPKLNHNDFGITALRVSGTQFVEIRHKDTNMKIKLAT